MIFPRIYLASQSPRRSELLQQMGVDFAVLKADVDESVMAGETPQHYVVRVAELKAKAGLDNMPESDKRPVLAADTAVVIDGQIFGKPTDQQHAQNMLQRLSGRTHQVLSAVALTDGSFSHSVVTVNDVRFTELSDAQIAWYLSTGEGVDKAGAYAVQGLAALFIEQISGSYSGIMGLPIRETGQLLMGMDSSSE